MGYREFKADLAAAKDAKFDRISCLRAGDMEGEIDFLYQHHEPPCQVQVQVIIQDVENYPRSREVVLFTASEGVNKTLIGRLQDTASHLVKKSVHEAIVEFSNQMAVAVPENATVEEAASPDYEDESTPSLQSDPWDESDLELDDDEEEYFTSRPSVQIDAQASVDLQPRDATEAQRKDLRQAMNSGFSVGVIGDREGQLGDIISLAISVSKLGLTDDGLAWGLHPTDHVMLLLVFPAGYPSLSEYERVRGEQSVVRVRFGKCGAAKPSSSSARAAFYETQRDLNHAAESEANASLPSDSHGPTDFVPLYIFSSITKLLNQDFPLLLSTRREHGISWNAAQVLLHRRAEGTHIRDSAYKSEAVDHVIEAVTDDDNQPSTHTHWILDQDDALVDEEHFSIPLVIMQFAVQRIIQSGKFCVNCHQKLEEGFEAMKPYVCSRPLCLHQYFSSGLGPSIEHEIITAPYVVDLLVSFFYSAVMDHRIREMPTGLGLKTFRPGTPEVPRHDHEGEACFVTKSALCGFTHPRIQSGERVLMVVNNEHLIPNMPILSSAADRYLCEVTSVGIRGFDFNIVESWTTMSREVDDNAPGVPLAEEKPPGAVPGKIKWRSVYIFRCFHEFDDLEEKERHLALLIMTCGIPSVAKMRQFLQAAPGKQLSSWAHLDHPTYKLLRWIVASNRSLIVYDDNAGANENDGTSTKVMGMEDNWMQFRFLQGSPEKELRFTEQIISSFPDDPSERAEVIPTLFAFHGSPLGNWHSIIRTSLDHSKTENGRSFGNGVYLSNRFETSLIYCRQRFFAGIPTSSSMMPHRWPQSQLKVSSAIAICEVLNRTAEFVSSTPHYVVQKLDWIQCRYLFVQVDQTEERIQSPTISRNSLGYLKQDPQRKLHAQGEIQIPASAIPVSRLRMFPHLSSEPAPKEWETAPGSQEKEEAFQGEDLDGLFDSSQASGA